LAAAVVEAANPGDADVLAALGESAGGVGGQQDSEVIDEPVIVQPCRPRAQQLDGLP
jgi:hypothetical protein